MIRQITHAQMIAMMAALRGATFVTFEARTVPDLYVRHPQTREMNPFLGNIVKIAQVNGTINFIYENAVNRQRTREELEADFEAMPRQWGRRIVGTPLVEHKGNHYLEVKVERSITHYYTTLDGAPLPTEQVERFRKPTGRSRQGVEREIILRDYGIHNIVEMRMQSEQYQLAEAA